MEAIRSILLRLLHEFVDEDHPLLVVFEDAQNMDTSSLHFLVNECSALLPYCIFLNTCRAEELAQNDEVALLLGELRGDEARTLTIPLEPLDAEAITEIIGRVYDAFNSTPESIANDIIERAQRNAFLARQMSQHLLATGVVRVVDVVVVDDVFI